MFLRAIRARQCDALIFRHISTDRQPLPGSASVEFDLRGVVQLSREGDRPGFPRAVEGIGVRQRCRRLQFLHATYDKESEDTLIGAYVLYYADGTRKEIPIQYGKDLLD